MKGQNMKHKFACYLAKSLSIQLNRAGKHIDQIVLEAWILAALDRLI